MENRERSYPILRILLAGAALVVIIAGLRAARELVVPFLLAVFIAVLCLSILGWLRRKGLPHWLAVLLIMLTFLLLGSVLALFVGVSVNSFIQALPDYVSRMDVQITAFLDWLKTRHINLSIQALADFINPGKAMTIIQTVVSALLGIISDGLVVLLIVLFGLVEVPSFPGKLRAAAKNPEKTLAAIAQFRRTAQQYVLTKTITSATTAVAIYIFLMILGVNYALLWSLLAFLLNFVPYIGSFLAAIPAVLLALAQFGAGYAALTVLGYVCINTGVGILEPRLMARRIQGLSALVVFLSLIFWGWILGPVGALLSVPLTTVVKIALQSYHDSRWAAALLGPVPSD